MLKPFLFLSAAILIAFTATPTSGRIPQEAAPAPAPAASTARNPVKPTPESQARAKTLYDIDCAMCHGDNGNGKTDLATSMQLTLSDWTDPKTLAAKSDGDLFGIIRNGKGKMFPEPEGRAKNDDVWNIILYIRNMPKEKPAAAPTPAN